jgi:hypothetical protein
MSDPIDALVSRRPRAELEVALPPGAKAEFWARGFTKIERITTDEEVEWLREVYDLLFSPETELLPGAIVRDVMTRLDAQRGDRQAQVLRPEWKIPALKQTLFWRNSRRLIAELLDLDTATTEGWGHMVRKAPGDPEALPWHQDEAFWDPRFDYRAAGCWMPLDPATVESGCMRMIPGSHLGGIHPHAYPNDDPAVTTLVCADAPEQEAVAHPIPIGGASFHHCRTLHGSGPNTTANARRAVVAEWQAKPVKREIPVDRPWYWARETAAREHFGLADAGA